MFDVESAVLIVGGRLAPTAEWTIPTHTHTQWELVYCLKGSGWVEFPDQSQRAQGYSLLVYPPGLPHAEISSSTDPEEIMYLRIDMEGQAPPGTHFLLKDPSGDMGWLCKHVVNECVPCPPHPLELYPEACLVYESFEPTPLAQHYTKALLYVVARELDRGMVVRHGPVDIAIQFMHDNYSSPITLDQLASLTCTSKTHLVHTFTAQMGVSPMKYLRQLRIEIARRILSTSNIPVAEVARIVGFREAYHFSKTFKTSVGCSPKFYRRI